MLNQFELKFLTLPNTGKSITFRCSADCSCFIIFMANALSQIFHSLSIINPHQTPYMGSKIEHFSRHIHKTILILINTRVKLACIVSAPTSTFCRMANTGVCLPFAFISTFSFNVNYEKLMLCKYLTMFTSFALESEETMCRREK